MTPWMVWLERNRSFASKFTRNLTVFDFRKICFKSRFDCFTTIFSFTNIDEQNVVALYFVLNEFNETNEMVKIKVASNTTAGYVILEVMMS